MPELKFSDILSRDAGKVGLVLGLGPSLNRNAWHINKVHKDKEHYKIVSCNNIDIISPELDFDYWVIAQPADLQNPLGIRRAWRRYNARKNTMLLYTDCLDLTPRDMVSSALTVDYIGYDQRHFKGKACNWGQLENGRNICCDGIIPGRLCIQEYFHELTGSQYGCGDTVAVHMLSVAVILGLNPIFITGVDLDYSKGYASNNWANADMRVGWGMRSINESPELVARILDDLRTIKRGANKIGIDIFCMDSTGRLVDENIFEYKKFEVPDRLLK